MLCSDESLIHFVASHDVPNLRRKLASINPIPAPGRVKLFEPVPHAFEEATLLTAPTAIERILVELPWRTPTEMTALPLRGRPWAPLHVNADSDSQPVDSHPL